MLAVLIDIHSLKHDSQYNYVCHPIDASDLSSLMENTKYLTLLAKVYQKAGRPENALEALARARESQARYIIMCRQLYSIGGGTHRVLGLKPPPPPPQYL